MEKESIDLGYRIKKVREEKNYSQTYLAQKLGITQKAYSNIENNQTRLTVDNLLRITQILEISINKILGYDENPVYNNFNTHNGEGIVINKLTSDKLIELYEKLLKSKDEEILYLKEKIGSLS